MNRKSSNHNNTVNYKNNVNRKKIVCIEYESMGGENFIFKYSAYNGAKAEFSEEEKKIGLNIPRPNKRR